MVGRSCAMDGPVEGESALLLSGIGSREEDAPPLVTGSSGCGGNTDFGSGASPGGGVMVDAGAGSCGVTSMVTVGLSAGGTTVGESTGEDGFGFGSGFGASRH